jgi:hypothetical protein
VEVWLGSDFVGGVTGKTYKFLMTKPTAGATFGSVKQSAHEWEVGLFIGAPGTIFYDFYRDFTGLRVFHNADGSTTTQPLTWGQSGNNLVNTRVTGQVKRIRTWTPIGTYGNKHFAFEDEYWLFPDGHTQPFIPPRVNFYVDNGVAVPPAGRPVQGQACRPCGKAARSTSLGFGPAIR